MDAGFLLASFCKSMEQMVDSVNINTDEMKKISQAHKDDEDQPLFGDVDIWFQETLKPILVPYISVSFVSKCVSKGERVSRPENWASK